MSQHTSQAQERPSLLARHHDLLPIFLVAMLFVGYLMFWTQAGTPAGKNSWLYVVGKNLVVPYANLFLLLYFILSRVIPPLQASLQTRHEEVKNGIRSFEERTDAIAQQYRDIKDKLANVDDEVDVILQRAETFAASESKKQLAQVEHQAERLVEDAHRVVEQELRRVHQDFQRDLIEKAFHYTEDTLTAHTNEQDHERLLDDYIQQTKG